VGLDCMEIKTHTPKKIMWPTTRDVCRRCVCQTQEEIMHYVLPIELLF
jgi:hypothetical protein